jgi:hypothetical protein
MPVAVLRAWVRDLVAVDEDARDVVLDRDSDRLPLVASSYPWALAGDGDRPIGRHASNGPARVRVAVGAFIVPAGLALARRSARRPPGWERWGFSWPRRRP